MHPQILIPGTECGGGGRCAVDKADIAELYAGLDLAYCIFFMIAYLWIRGFEYREGRLLERKVITVRGATPSRVCEREVGEWCRCAPWTNPWVKRWGAPISLCGSGG